MLISYTTDALGRVPQGDADLVVNGTDVASAAIGVGLHPGWGVGRARRTAFDAGWRSALVNATVNWNSGHVRKTRLYMDDLDPTEKGFASYHLGMTFAMAWARTVLQVRYLAHIDRFLLMQRHPPRGKRPDLLGADSAGLLYAIEAKGRSGVLGDAIETGKKQIDEAHYWFSLHGTPATGLVTATYFPNHTSPMRMEVRDPLSNAPMYAIDEDVLRAAALAPYAESITQQPSRLEALGGGVEGAEIGDTGVIVGLAPEAQAAFELPERRASLSERLLAYREPDMPQKNQESMARGVPTRDGSDLEVEQLPGVDDYRRIGSRLHTDRGEAEPYSYGDFTGRIEPTGVVVLTDDRWRTNR